MTPPTPITDPTTRPDVTRILLSARASQHLSETGTACFALVARDTWPGDRNRWVILLKPCPLALARQAEGVVLGSHKATRIKAAPMPASDAGNGTPAPAMPGWVPILRAFSFRTLPGPQLTPGPN
jgi:hypothetical protein